MLMIVAIIDDRMLVLFWIPILFSKLLRSVSVCDGMLMHPLLVGMIWAFLHAMRVGFNAMRAVLAVEMGLLRA